MPQGGPSAWPNEPPKALMLFILIYFLDDALVPTVAWAEAFAVCIPACHSIRVSGVQLGELCFEGGVARVCHLNPALSERAATGSWPVRLPRGEASVICIPGLFDVFNESVSHYGKIVLPCKRKFRLRGRWFCRARFAKNWGCDPGMRLM